MNNHMTQGGLNLLKRFEGWRSKAYKDAVGVWTIGYGHTSMAGEPQVTPKMVISKAEGEDILRRDLRKYEGAVRRAVKVDINNNQYSALVSFCYNVGPGNFRKSSVLRYVNKRQFDDVPARLALWNKAGGRVLRGLTRRRAAEGELFLTPAEKPFRQVAKEAMDRVEVDAPKGKSQMKSTTNIAAAVAGATAAGTQVADLMDTGVRVKTTVTETGFVIPEWVWPAMFILIAVGTTVWIIRERMRKSSDYGA